MWKNQEIVPGWKPKRRLIDKLRIFRGELLHSVADPAEAGDSNSYEYFPDGLLVVNSGLVEAIGPARELLPGLPVDVPLTRCTSSLLARRLECAGSLTEKLFALQMLGDDRVAENAVQFIG